MSVSCKMQMPGRNWQFASESASFGEQLAFLPSGSVVPLNLAKRTRIELRIDALHQFKPWEMQHLLTCHRDRKRTNDTVWITEPLEVEANDRPASRTGDEPHAKAEKIQDEATLAT